MPDTLITVPLALRGEIARLQAAVREMPEELETLKLSLFGGTEALRYIFASSVTEDQCEAVRASTLYAAGGAVLIWANEGDLCRCGVLCK